MAIRPVADAPGSESRRDQQQEDRRRSLRRLVYATMLVSTLNPLPVSCCSWQHGCRGGPRPFARGLLPTAALRHSSASLPLPPLPSAGGKGLCRLPPARATEDDRCLDRPTDGWSEAQAEKVHVSGLTVSPNGFFALLSPDLCSIQVGGPSGNQAAHHTGKACAWLLMALSGSSRLACKVPYSSPWPPLLRRALLISD